MDIDDDLIVHPTTGDNTELFLACLPASNSIVNTRGARTETRAVEAARAATLEALHARNVATTAPCARASRAFCQ